MDFRWNTERTAMTTPSSKSIVPPLLIATLVIGIMLNPINSTLIATALTPIGRSLHVGSAQTGWLVASLYLVAAVAQPLMGRLADLIGPRRVFLAGLVITGIGGVVGGLGPGLGWLIVSRMLIGMGTSAGYPSAMTVLGRIARQTGAPTPRATLAVITVATQVLAVIGPTLGGLLVGALGWRTVFWVNVPVVLIGLTMALTQLPRDGGYPRGPELLRRLDLAGALTFSLGLVGLLLFLMRLRPAPPYAFLVLSALSFGALFLVERRNTHAFIDLQTLAQNRPLLFTYLRFALTALIMYSIFYGLPQWLQEARGFSPAASGLLLLPISLVSIGVTLAVARLPRLGVRTMLLAGSALLIISVLMFAWLSRVPAVWLMVLASLLFGLPWGLNSLGNQQALTKETPPSGTGSAAGLFRTFGYLGSILSSSAISLTFVPTATTLGFQTLTWVLLGASLLLLLITLGLPREADRPRPQAQPDATG